MTAPQEKPLEDWRNNNFDAMRFLGALLVFVSHATFVPSGSLWADPLYALSGGQMTIGWVGVALFFVVSGYLITQSWERRSGLIPFLRARAVRIYPALIVVVVAIFLLGGLLSTAPNYFANPGALSYLGNIVVPFMDNHLPGVFQNMPSSGVSDNFWTLRYEIGCYVLLAAMGMLKVWRRDTVLVLFLLVSVLFALGAPSTNSGWLDLPRYFLAGSVLYLYRDRVRYTPGLVALALLALTVTVFTGGMKLGFSVFGAYVVLALAFARGPLTRLGLPRFGKYGDFSYGLYLVGLFVQQIVQRQYPALDAFGNFILSFPIALALAVLLWYTVEKPALALKNGRPIRSVKVAKPVAVRADHAGGGQRRL